MRTNAVSEAWGEWIAGMGEWHVFGALTYDPRRRSTLPGADVGRAHVRRWLGKDLRKAGVQVEAAIVAVEYHKNGWPHYHPLLRLKGGGQRGDFARIGQPWYKAHGYARLETPRDKLAVAAYASKYLAKDLSRGDVILWPVRGSLLPHQPALLGARAHEL